MKQTLKDWRIVITAIVGIVIIVSVAVSQGINGVGLSLGIGAIAGLAGWAVPLRKG